MIRVCSLLTVIAVFLFSSCSQNDNRAGKAERNMQEPAPATGEQLFKINCMQCHLPGKDFAGPALAGSRDRWKNKTLLYEFVRDPQSVIARDDYAAGLFEKWKQAPMNPSPHLKDKEIDAILDYCDEQGGKK